MSEYKTADYTFLGLCNNGKPMEHVNSLIYVLGLVDSPDNGITDLKILNSLLPQIYDAEELFKSPSDLLSWQEDLLPKGYFPQTPCMATAGWSPIGAMLDRKFAAIKLSRNLDFLANATGVWEAKNSWPEKTVAECKTQEELFWALLSKTFRHAKKRNMLVSVIAKPGWDYESAINSLPPWSAEEVAVAGRILWKRTPEG
jgi:hypothetical protein